RRPVSNLVGSYAKSNFTVVTRRTGYALLVAVDWTNRLNVLCIYFDRCGSGFTLVSHVPKGDVVRSEETAVGLTGRHDQIINGIGLWTSSAFTFFYDLSFGFDIWVRGMSEVQIGEPESGTAATRF